MEEKLNSLELEKREIIDLNRKEKEKKKIEYLIYEHDKTSFSSRIDQVFKSLIAQSRKTDISRQT